MNQQVTTLTQTPRTFTSNSSQPHPADETERLKVLRTLALLDTPPERTFDDITLLAANICRTPISLITLIDADRAWFKSKIGLTEKEVPRTDAFCSYALHGTEILMVEDAQRDEQFAQNPCVIGSPYIRFYAGIPLLLDGKYGLGTLCVIDREPRKLTLEQTVSLQIIGNTVLKLMEARRLENLLTSNAATPANAHPELLPICAECHVVRTDDDYWDRVRAHVSQHGNRQSKDCLCVKCAQKLRG